MQARESKCYVKKRKRKIECPCRILLHSASSEPSEQSGWPSHIHASATHSPFPEWHVNWSAVQFFVPTRWGSIGPWFSFVTRCQPRGTALTARDPVSLSRECTMPFDELYFRRVRGESSRETANRIPRVNCISRKIYSPSLCSTLKERDRPREISFLFLFTFVSPILSYLSLVFLVKFLNLNRSWFN